MEEFKLKSGHNVRIGDVYRLRADNKKHGLPAGTCLTVKKIDEERRANIGVHFDEEFPAEKGPIEGYQEDSPVRFDIDMLQNLLEARVFVEA